MPPAKREQMGTAITPCWQTGVLLFNHLPPRRQTKRFFVLWEHNIGRKLGEKGN